MAYDGLFDKVADVNEEGRMVFVKRQEVGAKATEFTSRSADVGEFIHKAISTIYK